MKLSCNPLYSELLTQQDERTDVESKEQLGEKTDYASISVARVALLPGQDQGLEGDPYGERPSRESNISMENFEPVDIPPCGHSHKTKCDAGHSREKHPIETALTALDNERKVCTHEAARAAHQPGRP